MWTGQKYRPVRVDPVNAGEAQVRELHAMCVSHSKQLTTVNQELTNCIHPTTYRLVKLPKGSGKAYFYRSIELIDNRW